MLAGDGEKIAREEHQDIVVLLCEAVHDGCLVLDHLKLLPAKMHVLGNFISGVNAPTHEKDLDVNVLACTGLLAPLDAAFGFASFFLAFSSSDSASFASFFSFPSGFCPLLFFCFFVLPASSWQLQMES